MLNLLRDVSLSAQHVFPLLLRSCQLGLDLAQLGQEGRHRLGVVELRVGVGQGNQGLLGPGSRLEGKFSG